MVRQAIRERYPGNLEERRKAMLEVIGSRKRKGDTKDAVAIVRELRRDHRLNDLARK